MKTKQFWYPLPTRLIAQHPSEKRGDDRMMVLHRDTGVVEHRRMADFPEYVTANDLLVVNDTKVFPARLLGTWSDSPGADAVAHPEPVGREDEDVARAAAAHDERIAGGLLARSHGLQRTPTATAC